MKKVLSILLVIVPFFISCSSDKEKYLSKAEKALKKENSEKALLYFREAYEASLGKEYWFRGKREKTDDVYSDATGSGIALIRIKGKDVKVTVYSGKKKKKRELDGIPHYAVFSPGAEYFYYQLVEEPPKKSDSKEAKAEEKCEGWVWSVKKDSQAQLFSDADCSQRPAVTADGDVFFMDTKGQIIRKNIEIQDEKIYDKTPDKPHKKLPAIASFFALKNGKVLLTYGSAGSYKLYDVTTNLELKRKDVSVYRVYLAVSGEPAVVSGGAGKQQMLLLNAKTLETKRSLPVRQWEDVVLMGNGEYYYLDSGILGFNVNDKDEVLPFWAKKLLYFSDYVYFHSPTGALLKWPEKIPNEEQMSYYQKGASLDEKR